MKTKNSSTAAVTVDYFSAISSKRITKEAVQISLYCSRPVLQILPLAMYNFTCNFMYNRMYYLTYNLMYNLMYYLTHKLMYQSYLNLVYNFMYSLMYNLRQLTPSGAGRAHTADMGTSLCMRTQII